MLDPDSDEANENSPQGDSSGRLKFQPISSPYSHDLGKDGAKDIKQRSTDIPVSRGSSYLGAGDAYSTEIPTSIADTSGIEDITPPPSEPASPLSSSPVERAVYETPDTGKSWVIMSSLCYIMNILERKFHLCYSLEIPAHYFCHFSAQLSINQSKGFWPF